VRTWKPQSLGLGSSRVALRRGLPIVMLTAAAVAALGALWWKLPVVDWLRTAAGWARMVPAHSVWSPSG
jgi:hypothetical protein